MLVLVQLYGTAVLDPLGFVSMTFNIINFGAPLAGMVGHFRVTQANTLFYLAESGPEEEMLRFAAAAPVHRQLACFLAVVPLWRADSRHLHHRKSY